MRTIASGFAYRALVAAMLATVAPALTTPAHAQRHEHRSTHDDGNRRFELSIRGNVWFTDDDRDIQRLEPGGRLMIEERLRFGSERMIIITAAANGDLQRTFIMDGQARPFDAAAQTWLSALLPEIIRETGVGAVERVKRIYGKRGAAAFSMRSS